MARSKELVRSSLELVQRNHSLVLELNNHSLALVLELGNKLALVLGNKLELVQRNKLELVLGSTLELVHSMLVLVHSTLHDDRNLLQLHC
jgi:hypothetical protein